MKVLVPVKRVIDYNVKVRVKADGSGVDLANVKMSMNPFDEIAIEEAIRLKEAGKAEEVIAVSVGVRQAQETLRTALAMGADRAILVVATEDVHQDIEPLAVAKILKAVVEAEGPGLVLCGKQAIDNDMNATGQMLAALLGWAQATFASELEVGEGSATVTREVDGGLQAIRVTLPAVVTVDLRMRIEQGRHHTSTRFATNAVGPGERRPRPGDLEARARVGDVLDADAGSHVLFKPADVPALGAIAGGQLVFGLGQAGDGEVTDDLAGMGQHGGQRQAARFRNAAGHDPVKPCPRVQAGDPVFAKVLHLVDADALAHRQHFLTGRLPGVGAFKGRLFISGLAG